MAFHVIDGAHDSTPLGGLNAVMVNDVPGNMRGGGYRTAVYVDEQGDRSQRAALESLFTGKSGGVFAGFAALTVEWLGVKHSPIQISVRQSVISIPNILSVSYAPMKGIGGKNAALVNTSQRIALGKKLNVGTSTNSHFTDYGIDWNNTGANVFWGTFSHSSTP